MVVVFWLWGILALSFMQYIIDGDIISIVLLAELGLVFVIAGILVKQWVPKEGEE